MKTKNVMLVVVLVALSVGNALALGNKENTDVIVITDYENRSVSVPGEVKRIVTLVPSALRILVQIGADDKLVGIDRKSYEARDTMLPFLAKPELLSLPVVGDRKEPNLEVILGLEPDVIITSSTIDKADALQRALGIPVICVVSEPDEDYEIIRLIGLITGRTKRAEKVITFLSEKAKDLRTMVSTTAVSSRKRVYLGLFTNSGRFTQTMPIYQSLVLAGGENVAADVKATTAWGSVEINKEQILAWDPDVVFIDWKETPAYLSMDTFMNDREYSLLSAVQTRKVYYSQTSHDGKDYVSALAEAYYMASILYPEIVSSALALRIAEEVFSEIYGLSGYYQNWAKRFGIL